MVKRVLLAEDEPNIVESLSFLLERAGYDVTIATTGRDALASAREAPPDALVLDVMLPLMDGYEVLRLLRTDRRTANLPVLMLTAKGQKEDREMALEAGANSFITKPFANSDIISAVDALTGSAAIKDGKP